MDTPIGYIPREFREIIETDLTTEEIEELTHSMSVFDNGVMRPMTPEEIRQKGVKRVTGVRDTRTGQYKENKYFQGDGPAKKEPDGSGIPLYIHEVDF